MAIKLNTSEPIPEYNRDEYLKKFIPLVFEYAPEFEPFKLRILGNKMNLGKERIIFGNLQNEISTYLLKNDFAINDEGEKLSLTDKGRDKKNGTEPWNRITKYQKIHIVLTCVTIITSIGLGVWNLVLNSQKSDLVNDNKILNSDLVRYKDSLNVYKEKSLLTTQKTLHDITQTKHLNDSNNETDLKVE